MIHFSVSMDMTDLIGLHPTPNSLGEPHDPKRKWQLAIDPEHRGYVYGTAADTRAAAEALTALADRLDALDAAYTPEDHP